MGSSQLRKVTLVVTERCNQRCSYCYVATERGRSMSPETARAAVDLLFDHGRRIGTLSLSFFGGEPFLASGLIETAAEHARRRRRIGQRLVFASPTNATALSEKACEVISRFGIDLAISIDGPGSERRFVDGGSTEDAVRFALARLRALPSPRLLARMTVTPRNVAALADNVRAVASLGFSQILYMPVFEDAWDATALELWSDQHHRLVAWLVARAQTGAAVLDLPPLRSILDRLEGSPRRHCGAGVTRLSVATDGTLYPCCRTAYGPHADEAVLGHVSDGLRREETLAAWAALSPTAAEPEQGDCARCNAGDGCTVFCPAIGLRMAGDINRVPAVACALMRPQVDAARKLGERLRAIESRRGRRALAASAIALALSGPGCADRALAVAPGDGAESAGAIDLGTRPPAASDLGPKSGPADLVQMPDMGARTDLKGVAPGDLGTGDTGDDMAWDCIGG